MINANDESRLGSCTFALLMVTALWGRNAAALDDISVASKSATATTSLDASSLADIQLQAAVTSALESDPYFYAAHVTVSVKNSIVVLHGFVFSDWDLRDAIRIASKAADGKRVVDDLAIEVGGRR